MTVAVLTLHLTAFLVFLVAALGGGSRFLWSGLRLRLRRRGPTRNLPDHTSKAFQLKTSPVPLPTRRARSVERAKSGIDSTLVCLRSEFMISASIGSSVRIDGTILPSRPN